MKTKFSALILVFVFILSACGGQKYTNADAVRDSGIEGKHEVGIFEPAQQLEGSISGRFFMLDGTIESKEHLSFDWSPKENRYVTTSLPVGMFITEVDDSLVDPLIEFRFSEKWLSYYSPYRDPTWDGTGYPYPQTALDDVNGILGDWGLVNVIVYISTEDLALEPFLPGPSR